MRRSAEEHAAGDSRKNPAWGLLLAAVMLSVGGAAHAGPPYLTDDPDPAEFGHWELYLASQWDHIGADGAEGNLPQLEINYGVLDGAMLHFLMPVGFIKDGDHPPVYGPGDMEVGANIRILEEGPGRPQIGTFPIAAIPVGNEAQGLGEGTVSLFLPIWLMKHVGAWTFDGGGGLHFENWDVEAQLGFFLQRTFRDAVTLGAEVFLSIPFDGSPVRTQINAAAVFDLSETHHLLFSGGPSFGADGGGQAYAAWQVTL